MILGLRLDTKLGMGLATADDIIGTCSDAWLMIILGLLNWNWPPVTTVSLAACWLQWD